MEYREEHFSIEIAEDTIVFSGKLEKPGYDKVSVFLSQEGASIPAETITIDLRDLRFMNSTGIRILAGFLIGTPKKFIIHIDKQITWQDKTVKTLSCLRPGDIGIKH